MKRTILWAAIASCVFVVVFALSPLVASATPIPVFSLVLSDGSNTWNFTPSGVDNLNGTFSYVDTKTNNGAGWELSWNVLVDPDPEVDALVALKNNTAFAKSYTVTETLPVSPINAGSLTSGSVSGSLTDVNGGGATLTTTSPLPIYQSKIDGGNWVALLPDPQSFSTLTSTTIGPAAFGPVVDPNPITTSIGIVLNFTLSPGDSASFTSVFTVVPEPSTAVLAACGAVALVGFSRVRRRKAGR